MKGFFKSTKFLLIYCAVFLCSFSRVGADEEGSGALRIETETEEYSADIHLGNTTDRKADKERKKIGVGEKMTLTLTGKPLGNVDELEWNLKEGGDKYIEMPEETKGKVSIIVTAKRRLQQGGSATIQAITSEGREVKTTLEVVVPSEIRAEHKNGGTATERLPEGLTTVIGASAVLKLTLYPTDVSFKNVKIIERDKGSEPSGTDFDPGHSRNGADEAIEVSATNQLEDNVTGGFLPSTWSIPIFLKRGTGCVRGASMMERVERVRKALTAAKSWKFGAILAFRNFTGRKFGGRSGTIS